VSKKKKEKKRRIIVSKIKWRLKAAQEIMVETQAVFENGNYF